MRFDFRGVLRQCLLDPVLSCPHDLIKQQRNFHFLRLCGWVGCEECSVSPCATPSQSAVHPSWSYRQGNGDETESSKLDGVPLLRSVRYQLPTGH